MQRRIQLCAQVSENLTGPIMLTSGASARRVSAWGHALASRVFGGVPELGLCIACAKQHSKRGGEREVYRAYNNKNPPQKYNNKSRRENSGKFLE